MHTNHNNGVLYEENKSMVNCVFQLKSGYIDHTRGTGPVGILELSGELWVVVGKLPFLNGKHLQWDLLEDMKESIMQRARKQFLEEGTAKTNTLSGEMKKRRGIQLVSCVSLTCFRVCLLQEGRQKLIVSSNLHPQESMAIFGQASVKLGVSAFMLVRFYFACTSLEE